MRSRWLILLPVLAGLFALAGCASAPYNGPSSGEARLDADVGDFYADLAPYGIWFYDDEFGWVWSPSGVGVDWRPYTFGEWAWTDDGWTWLSDEEWGWATYHYGRWCWRPARGWCWRPDRDWAPAWVAWRESDGWIGWCPLPPGLAWHDGFGPVDFDNLPGVEPFWWNFCGERDFAGPRVGDRLVSQPRAETLVRDSRSRADYRVRDGRVYTGGVDPVQLGERTGRPVPHYRVAELTARPTRGTHAIDRGTIYVYRPRVADARPGREPSALPPSHVGSGARVRPVAPARPAVPARPAEPARGAAPPRGVAPPRPAQPVEVNRALRERLRGEEQALERKHAARRLELQERHRAEEESPPAGEDLDALRARHEAERNALTAELARETELLRARHEAQLKGAGGPPVPPPADKAPRGRGAGDRRDGSTGS